MILGLFGVEGGEGEGEGDGGGDLPGISCRVALGCCIIGMG